MDGKQFLFFRGSTPTLELVLPPTVGPKDVLALTLAQGGQTVLGYGENPGGFPAGTGALARDESQENVLLLQMTRADTLALQAGDAELRLRLKNRVGADSFLSLTGRVGEALKGGSL